MYNSEIVAKHNFRVFVYAHLLQINNLNLTFKIPNIHDLVVFRKHCKFFVNLRYERS